MELSARRAPIHTSNKTHWTPDDLLKAEPAVGKIKRDRRQWHLHLSAACHKPPTLVFRGLERTNQLTCQASPFPLSADIVDDGQSEEVGGKDHPSHHGEPGVRVNNKRTTKWISKPSGGEGGRFIAPVYYPSTC